MDSTLQLKLLGLPEIVVNGVAVADQLPGKAHAILYYLAVTGQPQARTVLATLLWGDMPESAARTNLRKALAALHQTLDRYLQIERQSVAFKPGIKLRVDAVEFETGMSAAAPADIDRLQAAVDLYRGDFLTGFYVLNAPDFENWMYAEQARLREAMIQALHQLTSHFAGQGDFLRGIASVRRLLNLEPWREEAHRQLVVLLARNGQRSAALAQFDACRQVLFEELGVEPGRETVALYERIRDGEAGKNAQERPAENSPATPLSALASARFAATYNYQEGQEIFASTAAHLPQTRRLAGQPGFDLTMARVLARQGAFLYWLGDFDAARRQLAASLQATLPRRERAFVHLMFGKIARLQGRRSEAEEALGQALALNREAGDTGGMADALLGLAEVSGSFSDYTAGKSWATESLALYRKIQRPDRIAQALGALAWNMICLGAYGEAVACYEESLAICRKIGDQNGVALAVEFLGWVAWCEGRAFEAVSAYQQALAIYRQIGERSRLSMCLGDLALALIDLGIFPRPKNILKKALPLPKRPATWI